MGKELMHEKDVPEGNELGYPASIVDQTMRRNQALELCQKR
jgi:hypothetical protein